MNAFAVWTAMADAARHSQQLDAIDTATFVRIVKDSGYTAH